MKRFLWNIILLKEEWILDVDTFKRKEDFDEMI